MNKLEIITWNTWQTNYTAADETRGEVITDFLTSQIENIEPDIIALQEYVSCTAVATTIGEIAFKHGYNLSATPNVKLRNNPGKKLGQLLMYRPKLISREVTEISRHAGKRPGGYSAIATLLVEGQEVGVSNNHLGDFNTTRAGRLVRKENYELFPEFVNPHNHTADLITLGDLNSIPSAKIIRMLREDHDLRTTDSILKPTYYHMGVKPTGLRVDYIGVNHDSAMKIGNPQAIGLGGSDHQMLHSTIRW